MTATKKQKKVYLILGSIIIIAGLILVVVRFNTEEDTWVCSNSQWVKHGNPASLAPTGKCGNSNNQNSNPSVNTSNSNSQVNITSYDDCVAAGYPVMESYPSRCAVPGGQTYTQNIGNELEMTDEIKVDNPRPNQKISSPITISGQARGTWFFEAVMPVTVKNANGAIIGSGNASAQDEWMTTDFVPFTLKLEFSDPQTSQGNIFINNENPSGLNANQKQLEIPVKF
ncbi:MAG: Gmad2 immunoglobulin-like domain-containing protein [Patescibacteria group bacterium]